jgi:DUF4097 and DUF4098 domain-containing protein YvlB
MPDVAHASRDDRRSYRAPTRLSLQQLIMQHRSTRATPAKTHPFVIATVGIPLLLVLASCTNVNVTTDEQSYDVVEQVESVIIDARAAAITVQAGNGATSVTETYHYSDDKPRTSHEVSGTTLRLTESGCETQELRCDVEFSVHVPADTAVDITARAGAVRLTGLTSDVTVVTDAGAVEGTGLAGDSVSVKTDAGATSLQFTEPPASVEASTELGAILLKVPGGTAYAVDVSTTAGGSDIRVQQDANSPHKISLRTEVGGIRVENG